MALIISSFIHPKIYLFQYICVIILLCKIKEKYLRSNNSILFEYLNSWNINVHIVIKYLNEYGLKCWSWKYEISILGGLYLFFSSPLYKSQNFMYWLFLRGYRKCRWSISLRQRDQPTCRYPLRKEAVYKILN